MSNKLVGIRFIANKDLMEDTVTNSGAVWTQGQVLNFSANLAIQLLNHPDVFELADLDPDADTFLGKVTKGGSIEPVSFININAMDEKALAAYSRMEFNKNVNLENGRTLEEIRSEVFSYMTNANLDLEAIDKTRLLASGMILEKEVTVEEYKAVLEGVLVLKLVPAVAISTNPSFTGGNADDLLDRQGAVIDLIDTNTAAEVLTSDTEAETAAEKPAIAEESLTLPELVAKLDKEELRAFAKQESVPYANSMNEDQLRAKLIRDLTARATPPVDSTAQGL